MTTPQHRNETRNQHYVSQTELRLNASNPGAGPGDQCIYAFDVTDRHHEPPRLRSMGSRKIARSLCCLDLFSFNVVDRKYRSNLESLFNRYEGRLGQVTQTLLDKLRGADAEDADRDIRSEVRDLYDAKFLNLLRNPYGVRKALGTFRGASELLPHDAELREAYNELLNGRRPHQAHLCREYGLSEEEYAQWLRVLLNLLTVGPEEQVSPFELINRAMFESHRVFVWVQHYFGGPDSDVCLLSDRGYNVPVQTDTTFAIEFNISKEAFVRFEFLDPSTSVPPCVPAEVIALAAEWSVCLRYRPNDLAALADYNRRTAQSCYKGVYAASSSPLLRGWIRPCHSGHGAGTAIQ